MIGFLTSTVFLASAAALVAGLWLGTRYPDLFSRVWAGLWHVVAQLATAVKFVVTLPARLVGLFRK